MEAWGWLSTVEPRSVGALIKRVVEDSGEIDGQVAQLYDEGQMRVRQLPHPWLPVPLRVLRISQQQWGHDQSELLQVTSSWNRHIRTKKA